MRMSPVSTCADDISTSRAALIRAICSTLESSPQSVGVVQVRPHPIDNPRPKNHSTVCAKAARLRFLTNMFVSVVREHGGYNPIRFRDLRLHAANMMRAARWQ